MSLRRFPFLGGMSYKVDVFRAAVPAPMTKRDITLWWPVMPSASILVQSLTFPVETMTTVTVPYRGVPHELPTYVYQPGDWAFELPETFAGGTFAELADHYYNRRSMSVYLVLGNVLNSLNFSGNFAGSLLSAGAGALSAVRSGVVLNEAFIKSIAPVDFSMSQPEQAVLWRVTMHYGYVSPLSKVLGI